MTRTRTGPFLSALKLAALVPAATLLLAAQDQGNGKGNGKPSGGWEEQFNSPLSSKKWLVSDGFAPGYRPDQHEGYYESGNVVVQNGYLVMRLWQESGAVDGNPDGVISHGAHISSKQKYGYGTYEYRMRMSSTATTPAGAGDPVSGSVSAGFTYVNNSETEIDFEFGGHAADTLYMANWHNTDPATGPFDDQLTFTTAPLSDISDAFHTYKFVWAPGSISYYVDDALQAVHTTDVPTAPSYFMINHWGTDNEFWGGAATLDVDRYFYVDWVRFTPS